MVNDPPPPTDRQKTTNDILFCHKSYFGGSKACVCVWCMCNMRMPKNNGRETIAERKKEKNYHINCSYRCAPEIRHCVEHIVHTQITVIMIKRNQRSRSARRCRSSLMVVRLFLFWIAQNIISHIYIANDGVLWINFHLQSSFPFSNTAVCRVVVHDVDVSFFFL